MTQTEQWTVGRLLTWTTDYLKQREADSPRLDAEVLLAHARRCERIELYTCYTEVVDDATRGTFRELVRKRAEGAPVAYLVGRREFYSLSFEVTPDVLIPRPETEFLVVAALDQLPQGAPSEVVDVGTGSGVIAICIAKYAPQCSVTAVDSSPAALDIAIRNAAASGVESQIAFLESDLLAAVAGRQFDLIVSNPPYVSEAEYEQLDATVRRYEPRSALVAGPTGVEQISRLAAEAVDRLKPGGWLWVEISPMIADRVETLLSGNDSFQNVQVRPDLAGHPRIAGAQRK